jgi:hypothetical protein
MTASDIKYYRWMITEKKKVEKAFKLNKEVRSKPTDEMRKLKKP